MQLDFLKLCMCIASEEKRVEDNNNNNRQGCYIHGSANSVGESKLTGGREKKNKEMRSRC
jgi:hypothetical protein